MKWRDAVANVLAGWPQPEKSRVLTELAADNDHAERIGFECHPDDRLGFGRCYYTKGHERVWESTDGWTRATLTSVVGVYRNYRYYHTLGQALADESPRATRDEYGNFRTV